MLSLMLAIESISDSLATIEDNDIICLINGGSNALHAFYEKTNKSIYGFALSITKNTFDAEDVLQETVLAVYNNATRYEAKGKPMAWVLTIAKNFALAKHRAASRITELNEDINHEISFDNVTDIEHKMIIEAAFKVLSDDERNIVTLKAVSGLKTREVAALLQIPLGTALSKYHRALEKLQQELKGGFFDEK